MTMFRKPKTQSAVKTNSLLKWMNSANGGEALISAATTERFEFITTLISASDCLFCLHSRKIVRIVVF